MLAGLLLLLVLLLLLLVLLLLVLLLLLLVLSEVSVTGVGAGDSFSCNGLDSCVIGVCDGVGVIAGEGVTSLLEFFFQPP